MIGRQVIRRWVPALIVVCGLLVTCAGVFISAAEADARLSSITIVGQGELPEGALASVRHLLLSESVRSGTGGERNVTVIAEEGGWHFVEEGDTGSNLAFGAFLTGWHLTPIMLTSACGVMLTILGLFLGAAAAAETPRKFDETRQKHRD